MLNYEILITRNNFLKVVMSDKIREIRFSNLWGGPLNENLDHIFAAQHALNIYKSNSNPKDVIKKKAPEHLPRLE